MKVPPVTEEGSRVYGQFDPLPEGEHNVCVAGFRVVKTKAGDHACVVDFIEVMAPDSDHTPRASSMWMSWDPEQNIPIDHWARHKWRILVKATGRDPSETIDTNDLIGEPVGIVVKSFNNGKPMTEKVFSLTTGERVDGKEFWEEFTAKEG